MKFPILIYHHPWYTASEWGEQRVAVCWGWGLTVFSFHKCPKVCGGQDSIAGIATCSMLDGPGFESSWRCDFPCCPDWVHSVSCTLGTASFLGSKAVRTLYYHPPVLVLGCNELELYFHFIPLPAWACRGVTFTWCLKWFCVCVLLEVFGYASDIWCDSCATKVSCWWKNNYFWPVC